MKYSFKKKQVEALRLISFIVVILVAYVYACLNWKRANFDPSRPTPVFVEASRVAYKIFFCFMTCDIPFREWIHKVVIKNVTGRMERHCTALRLYLVKVVAVTLARPGHLQIVSTCESKNHSDWDGSLRPHAQSISGQGQSSVKEGCCELAPLWFGYPHVVLHLPSLKANFIYVLCGLCYIDQNRRFCSTIVNWSLRHPEQGPANVIEVLDFVFDYVPLHENAQSFFECCETEVARVYVCK